MNTNELYTIIDELIKILVLEHKLANLLKSKTTMPLFKKQQKIIYTLAGALSKYEQFTKPK